MLVERKIMFFVKIQKLSGLRRMEINLYSYRCGIISTFTWNKWDFSISFPNFGLYVLLTKLNQQYAEELFNFSFFHFDWLGFHVDNGNDDRSALNILFTIRGSCSKPSKSWIKSWITILGIVFWKNGKRKCYRELNNEELLLTFINTAMIVIVTLLKTGLLEMEKVSTTLWKPPSLEPNHLYV